MFRRYVHSAACATPLLRPRAAAPVIRDMVSLMPLLDEIRRINEIRGIARADAEEFSRRIDHELPRYRALAACYERTQSADARRELQSSLHHLHNLRFAVSNATAAVKQADKLIAGIRRRVTNLRVCATGNAA